MTQSDTALPHRSIYVGQRVKHRIAGLGRVEKIIDRNSARVQYEDGPKGAAGKPPRGIAWIADLTEATDDA